MACFPLTLMNPIFPSGPRDSIFWTFAQTLLIFASAGCPYLLSVFMPSPVANNDLNSLIIFIPMIPDSPLISSASGRVSVSTKMHFPGRTFPMHSTSACKHPRTGMSSPLAAVSLTQ